MLVKVPSKSKKKMGFLPALFRSNSLLNLAGEEVNLQVDYIFILEQ